MGPPKTEGADEHERESLLRAKDAEAGGGGGGSSPSTALAARESLGACTWHTTRQFWAWDLKRFPLGKSLHTPELRGAIVVSA